MGEGAGRGRNNALDFLWLIAALAVLVQHPVIHLDAWFLRFTRTEGL
jgi:hypothetical protein